MPKAKRAAVYLRQSQDRSGEGLGVDRQREDVRRLCEARGWTIAAEFVDNDVSATSGKPREQFNAMMARVDAGEFDVIVARHMDRLLRRLAELESVLERCAAANVAIVTASDGVDTSTDGGRLVARILSSVAQGEVERKSARQRSAAVQAAKQGRWIGGRRPFGYEADGVTIREDEAAVIKQGYADILTGESVAEVARRFTASGLSTGQGTAVWERSAVKDVLTNPRNAGLRRYRAADERVKSRHDPELGIMGKAEWPAIVDEATWRACVRVLCDPSRRRPGRLGRGLLTGVAVCGVCGLTMRRGGARRDVPTYRCQTGKHVSRLAQPVDEYVSELAIARLTAPDSSALWTSELSDVAELMVEADTLRRRREDIALDYADGVMTRDQFRTANERVLERLGELESQIAAAGTNSPLAIVASKDVRATWEGLSTAQRRNIIDALMTVKLHPPGVGTRTFRPESVQVHPR